MNIDFKKTIAEQANKEIKTGKVVIISGVSGSGKSFIADMLVNNHNYAYINKYVTRPLRQNEINQLDNGKATGVRPVKGKYNDGEKSQEEQEKNASMRKQAFLNLRLPLSYINYDNYYGFSTSEIDNYIENGRNVVIIVNDTGVIQDLKNIYGKDCISCYVHRANPKSKDTFIEIAKQRGDTSESAEKRYQKAIKDFDIYTNNITLYDHTILNTQEGIERLSQMLRPLEGINEYKKQQDEKSRWNGKIYAFIGSPGSGKDETLETIRVQGVLHSIIMPKHTTRARREDDGEEMICPDDERYDMDSCDIQYTNYGNTYGINTRELHQRLEDGVSSSIVVSNTEALRKLQEEFPDDLVKIYIHGLSKEEYEMQQKEHLDEEYVRKRLEEYDKADKMYCNDWLEFDNVMINNGDLADLKFQVDNIMRHYEEDRNISRESYKTYMQKVNKYISRFARKYEGEEVGKFE